MIPFASGFSWFNGLLPDLVGRDELVHGLGTDPLGTALAHGSSSIVVHAWFGAAVVLTFALIARMGLMKARAAGGNQAYFADETLTARTFFEVFAEGTTSVMSDVLGGADVKAFFPLIGTLFMYIFVNNIMGIFPGFMPPTDNVNTNFGMGVVVFFTFLIVGLVRDPVGFLKHLWGPMFAVGFLLFPIEVIGLLFRPVSLSLRLTGNMFGDHQVFLVMSDLTYVVIPSFFLALAIFVSFMQSFVFSLLTTIYIGMSVPHHDHTDEGHHH